MNNETNSKIMRVGVGLMGLSYDLHNEDCEEQGFSDMEKLQSNCFGCKMYVTSNKLMSYAEANR